MSESRSGFLKQGAWMVAATLAGGVGMTLVHVVVGKRGGPEVYAQFKSLLAIFYVVGAAQGGLWNLLARQTATALTSEALGDVVRGAWRLAGTIAAAMALAAVPLAVYGPDLAVRLKLPSVAALWATWGLILATLLAALIRGLLQGGQNFAGLGQVAVLDGFGRFVAVALFLYGFAAGSAGAVTGALVGNLAAIAVGLWGLRALPGKGVSPSATWPTGFMPLFFSAAALQTLGQLDNLFLQAVVPASGIGELGRRYSPGAQIGFALTQFTVPLALVMFPKVARGAASGAGSDALRITFLGTLVLGGLAVLGCLAVPWLPVRVLFPGTPASLSAPLVPWFAGAMLCYTLANVLLSDRLARGDYRFVPWVTVLAGAYAATLWGFRDVWMAGEPADAFRRVVLLLGAFNGALLALAVLFNRLGRGDAIAPTPPTTSPAAAR
jgi:O-antigen/teichoic acid export membrane protein